MADNDKRNDGLFESPADAAGQGVSLVRAWLASIELASEEEKPWRDVAADAVDVYSAEDTTATGTRFNLYHANIETLVPSVYNSQPTPDVRRRYDDRDPQGADGSEVIERLLSYSMDDCDFDAVINRSIYHLAIAGRGVVRVAYEGELDGDDVGSQRVCYRLVPWAGFRRGPGRVWDDVAWVAFAHYMTREELMALGPGGAGVKLDHSTGKDSDESNDGGAKGDKPEGDIYKRALVWEIWDKPKRRVLFIAPSLLDKPVAVVDDPLGLKQFFPIPRPIMTLTGNDTLVPLCPYAVYKPILDEIDRVTARITQLVVQLRPRALGPQGADLDAWAQAKDGEIVAISDIAGFMANGGMDKLLAWFPMEPTIKAIESLYQHREMLKQSLFEVSGVADIMRGQSDASETLGAQQIKTQWGSLRIQRIQSDVQRFVRDLLRIAAEIMCEHFTPENIAAMAGIQPQTSEEMQDFMGVVQLIKDEKGRSYRIDIETDSTIKGDVTRNMANMAQFVQGSAQYFQAFGAAQQAGFPLDALVTIYSAFARNFKLGKQVDDILDKLPEQLAQAMQQKGPDPEQQKLELEKAKMAMDAQMAQSKAAADAQAAQAEVPLKQMDLQLKQMDLKLKEMDLAMKGQQMQHADKSLALQEQQASNDVLFRDREIGMKDAEMKANHRHKGEELKLKAQGKDVSTRVQVGTGDDEIKAIAGMFDGLAKIIAQSNENTAKLIAAGNAQVVRAVSAPKTVTTPDGRTYTSRSAELN